MGRVAPRALQDPRLRLPGASLTSSLFLPLSSIPPDTCPETGRVHLGYDRARVLIAHYGDGLRLHQLHHSIATHLGEANVSANVIMAKIGHKSLRSIRRYVKPGLAAVHQTTETLSRPRRRG